MGQTFILQVWYNGYTYIDAGKKSNDNIDFYRFSYKKAKTVKKALKSYVEQAAAKGLEKLYPYFFSDGGMYQILDTQKNKIIETGYIKDLK